MQINKTSGTNPSPVQQGEGDVTTATGGDPKVKMGATNWGKFSIKDIASRVVSGIVKKNEWKTLLTLMTTSKAFCKLILSTKAWAPVCCVKVESPADLDKGEKGKFIKNYRLMVRMIITEKNIQEWINYLKRCNLETFSNGLKLDLSQIDIDRSNVRQVQQLLNIASQKHSNITSIALRHIYTTLDLSVLEKFKNLRTLSFGHIRSGMAFPAMSTLRTLSFGDIWGRLTVLAMGNLRTLSFGDIYNDIPLPAMGNLRTFTCGDIGSSVVSVTLSFAEMRNLTDLIFGKISWNVKVIWPKVLPKLETITHGHGMAVKQEEPWFGMPNLRRIICGDRRMPWVKIEMPKLKWVLSVTLPDPKDKI